MYGDGNLLERIRHQFTYSWPRPRVIVVSFPHNPTTTCVDLDFFQGLVDFAREQEVIVVHDNAYAELGFDGYQPPSIMQAEGAKECAVELYSMTKSFSMAGWRVAFMVGNAEVVGALAKLKSYLDYGTFQPIQIAATVTLNEATEYPKEVQAIYQARRDALCDGLDRIGWDMPRPGGTMFAWAPIPEPYRHLGSVEFAKKLVTEAHVACSPGVGFGPGGEGYVRFALIENEQRIHQAMRGLKRALPELARLATDRGRRASGRALGADALAAAEQAVPAEVDDLVGDLVGRSAPAEQLRAGQDRADAEDRLGEITRVAVGDRAGGMASSTSFWVSARATFSPLRMPEAKLASVRANSMSTYRSWCSAHHAIEDADAELEPADRVGLVAHAVPLRPADGPLALAEDLHEELLLRLEVPVEDALADAEAVDQLGDRGRVVAVGRRSALVAKAMSSFRRCSPRGVSRRAMRSSDT